MFRSIVLLAVFAAAVAAHPGAFTFVIGNAVASQDFQYKSAAFALRTEGCADPAKAKITAAAEGLVNGARRSMSVKVMPSQRPGVYAVIQSWPEEGAWVVSLRGVCGSENAGAIVPFGPKGMIRESAKFYARPATNAEIDAALKALASVK
jgi:hypothetical protein